MSATLNEATVGQLVAQKPGRARVFQKLGIDFCCGGKKRLADACLERGLDPEQVLQELERDEQDQPVAEQDWTTAPLGDLADHIEQVHHRYLKEELPRLEALARKVASVHGTNHPELIEIHRQLTRVKGELESHILREELVLFPLCRKLGQTHRAAWMFGPVENPIAAMVREHEETGETLGRIRALSSDFTPPAEACNSYRALFDGLRQLEADLHQHIHKENNILFPRAIEAEAKLHAP